MRHDVGAEVPNQTALVTTRVYELNMTGEDNIMAVPYNHFSISCVAWQTLMTQLQQLRCTAQTDCGKQDATLDEDNI